MAPKKSRAASLKINRAGGQLVDAEGVRSQIMKAIVHEVANIGTAAAGTYTKPDGFQNGQYGKYEKGDSVSRLARVARGRPGG